MEPSALAMLSSSDSYLSVEELRPNLLQAFTGSDQGGIRTTPLMATLSMLPFANLYRAIEP